jgi:hypothetical protein
MKVCSEVYPSAAVRLIVLIFADDLVAWYSNALKVTEGHIQCFLEQCRDKYLRAMIEPGMYCSYRSSAFRS